MDDSKWERWAALGGIVFVVLTAITFAMSGSPPKTTDSAGEIAQYVVDKDTQLRWAAYIGTIAVLPILWWAGSLWRRMSRAEGGAPRLTVFAFGGLIFGGAMASVATVIFSVLAIRGVAGSGGPDGTKFFYVLGWVLNGASMFGLAAFTAAASALIIRTGVFPKALGWYGALVAIAGLVGGASIASTRDVFAVFSLIAFLGWMLWILIASVVMLRGPAGPAGPAATTAAAPAASAP